MRTPVIFWVARSSLRGAEAREPFGKELRASPRDVKAKVHRAIALNYVGLLLPADAEKHFREAERLYSVGKTAAEDPRIDYGAFLVREGRADEALRPLKQAAESHPDSSRANAELGKALMYAGQPGIAVSSLEKAVALDARAWPVRLLLGRAYLLVGRKDDAERELRIGQSGWTSEDRAH